MLDTFKVAAELGPESLSAYVISMATRPSDVLAVELLKREASLAVSSLTTTLRPSEILLSLAVELLLPDGSVVVWSPGR